MSQKTQGLLFTLLSGIGFAIASILMRALNTLTTFTPTQVAILRFLFAAPITWLFLPHQLTKKLGRKVRMNFIFLGLIFSGASFAAVFALDRLPSSLYIILLFTYPSMVTIYSMLTGKPVPALTWIGLPLSVIGIILMVLHPGNNLRVDWIGVGLVLINALILAVYFILSGKFFPSSDLRLSGTTWIMTGGFLVSLLIGIIFGIRWPQSWLEWLMILGLSIFGTVIPILSANFGIQLIGPARASMLVSIQPILTILLSLVFFQEVLSPLQWVGAVLLLSAIVLLQSSPDRLITNMLKQAENRSKDL